MSYLKLFLSVGNKLFIWTLKRYIRNISLIGFSHLVQNTITVCGRCHHCKFCVHTEYLPNYRSGKTKPLNRHGLFSLVRKLQIAQLRADIMYLYLGGISDKSSPLQKCPQSSLGYPAKRYAILKDQEGLWQLVEIYGLKISSKIECQVLQCCFIQIFMCKKKQDNLNISNLWNMLI